MEIVLNIQSSRVRPPGVEEGAQSDRASGGRSYWVPVEEETGAGGGGGVGGAADAGERRGRSCGRRRGRSREAGRRWRRSGRRCRRLRERAEPERELEMCGGCSSFTRSLTRLLLTLMGQLKVGQILPPPN